MNKLLNTLANLNGKLMNYVCELHNVFDEFLCFEEAQFSILWMGDLFGEQEQMQAFLCVNCMNRTDVNNLSHIHRKRICSVVSPTA